MSGRHRADDPLPWDEAAGPLVRPYAVTGGRTRSTETRLDMISTVVASRREADTSRLQPEHLAILRLCRSPMSVAEVAARLDLPVTVVKVLLGDLVTQGFVLARAPVTVTDRPEMTLLQAVLDGIRRL
ncbi:DUF742 domain-containing protein [Thermobifida cellulosilytica]|uniref:DUF742 domain-containing protein n=1 Tax=Thermobifida cellulosilytica TB100 TaxID=665004 RepID=A0A147KFS1_THECS|nr:DUF742 domain-containing protein [Thermobifida cellulosilytica]KUP96161.1 hypothetical protein AC529_14025 [Thermobifida cellulosilytica TB100]